MGNSDPNDFVVLCPGVSTEREESPDSQYLSGNKALEERGDIDVQALIDGSLPEDTPGLGASYVASEAMIRYNNVKHDPENPVLNDAEYAQKLGYRDTIAMPCFGANDNIFMVTYPPDARDTLLVSQLNHTITSYVPVYPRDTLYLVANSRHVTDYAPTEGSIHRSYALPSVAGKMCIPFCTHGASPTGFFWSIVPMLQKSGLTIIGYGSWYGSVYQVLHAPKPYLTEEHPDAIALQEGKAEGRFHRLVPLDDGAWDNPV